MDGLSLARALARSHTPSLRTVRPVRPHRGAPIHEVGAVAPDAAVDATRVARANESEVSTKPSAKVRVAVGDADAVAAHVKNVTAPCVCPSANSQLRSRRADRLRRLTHPLAHCHLRLHLPLRPKRLARGGTMARLRR